MSLLLLVTAFRFLNRWVFAGLHFEISEGSKPTCEPSQRSLLATEVVHHCHCGDGEHAKKGKVLDQLGSKREGHPYMLITTMINSDYKFSIAELKLDQINGPRSEDKQTQPETEEY